MNVKTAPVWPAKSVARAVIVVGPSISSVNVAVEPATVVGAIVLAPAAEYVTETGPEPGSIAVSFTEATDPAAAEGSAVTVGPVPSIRTVPVIS